MTDFQFQSGWLYFDLRLHWLKWQLVAIDSLGHEYVIGSFWSSRKAREVMKGLWVLRNYVDATRDELKEMITLQLGGPRITPLI